MIEETGENQEMEAEPDFENEGTMDVIPEVSFHAIAGTEHPQTIRVKGKLKNQEMMVLIDGGSTHNFIDQTVVTKFGIPVERNHRFHVMVANKERIECAGQCHALSLQIQGYPVKADFFVLPVAAYPLVLGVQWMATLGPIQTDYKQLTMEFKQNGIPYCFQGIRQQEIEALSHKDSYGTGFFIQLLSSSISNKHALG